MINSEEKKWLGGKGFAPHALEELEEVMEMFLKSPKNGGAIEISHFEKFFKHERRMTLKVYGGRLLLSKPRSELRTNLTRNLVIRLKVLDEMKRRVIGEAPTLL